MRLVNVIKNRSWLVLLLIVDFWFVNACGELAPAKKVTSNDTTVQKAAAPPNDAADQVVAVAVGNAQAPAEQGFYQGVAAGFTEEGYPFLGNPEASVTLEEYSDFLCPFCQRHFQQTWPALFEKYVQSGEVKYVFRDMPLVSLHPTAPVGHVAARCASEQGAAFFWAMHDALFARQNEWRNLPNPSGFLAGVAQEVGVEMTAYQDCVAAGDKDSQVQESVAAGSALGFNGTPSFQFVQNASDETYILVGAYPVETFNQWLDALVAGEVPPQAEEAETEPAELPFWANADGLAPDPERPGYTMAGDAYKGNSEAEVVVVEFSDFQCPACQQHVVEIQPALDQALIDSGEVMWVFKHLPLKEHTQALAAAVAAECAGDQGRFWEMHHRLFVNLEAWAVADVDAQLLALAEEEGLDMAAFSACLNSRVALERVVSDMYDAQGVTERTPAFVVLHSGRGTLLTGSRPPDEFERLIRTRLEGDSSNS